MSAPARTATTMTPCFKIGIVAGGYIAALFVAVVAAWIRLALTNGPGAQERLHAGS